MSAERRTLTLDIDTGDWVDPKHSITHEEALRLSASLLPLGAPGEDEIATALDRHMEEKYGFVMASDDRDVVVQAAMEVIRWQVSSLS